VNYIYGTWQVLQGLKAIDFPRDHPAVVRAVHWLESVQQPCGGWGESCASYDDRSLMGQGEPSASQTAWAVLGLVSAGRAESAAVRRGIRYLQSTQQSDGSWDEPAYTGTGFPRVFYLKYHLYRIFFPLMALSRYQEAVARRPGGEGEATMKTEASPGALACRIPAQPRPFDV
jgi:squalene-hopene/tetraprenyl-beta-curcumene cyclase